MRKPDPKYDPVVTCVNGHWQGDWADGYTICLIKLDESRVGSYPTEVETLYHGDPVAPFALDFLNRRSRDKFILAMGSKNGVSPIAWDKRLDAFYRLFQQAKAASPAQSPWAQAQTAEAFLTHEDEDIKADARDLLVPGCVTLVAAPAASGKTLVALYLAVALAEGGVFRGQQLPTRRVLLVDRDNPPALIKKRLRWLGADKVTNLKVLTRTQAPPLTDAPAWAAFPAEDYEVVMVDSIGAATEGVSEKEGKRHATVPRDSQRPRPTRPRGPRPRQYQ